MSRTRRSGKRRRWQVLVSLPAALAVGGLVIASSGAFGAAADPLPPEMQQFAVFADGTREFLPPSLSAEVATWPGALGDGSQFVSEDADGKLFLIPGKGGLVCFMVTGPNGTAGSCGRTTTRNPVVVGGYRFPGGPEQAVLVAPDGYSEATYAGTSRVFASNVVKIPLNQSAGSIEVAGPSSTITLRP